MPVSRVGRTDTYKNAKKVLGAIGIHQSRTYRRVSYSVDELRAETVRNDRCVVPSVAPGRVQSQYHQHLSWKGCSRYVVHEGCVLKNEDGVHIDWSRCFVEGVAHCVVAMQGAQRLAAATQRL
jgi:hypothetical protein